MQIGNQDVPNDLIFEYCRVIKTIENNYNSSLEYKRKELHNQIFECVGCERSLYRKKDRVFNKALNITVMNLIFEKGV